MKLHIDKKELGQWLDSMIAGKVRVVAPVRHGDKVDFQPIGSSGEVADGYVQTALSAKSVVFPRAEELFSYKKSGKDVTLRENDAADMPQTVVWKARPCDAAGLIALGGIFNWDYKDGLYNARRAKVAIVTFSCVECDADCFCTSVGGGPGNTRGSDMQITELPDGTVLVETLTQKGDDIAAKYLKNANAGDDIDKSKYLANVPVRFAIDDLRGKLAKAFDIPVWKEQSERCLGCGVCAFVCPTCACFDIEEDAKGSTGRRVRCWDSCGFSLFTQHTSGHNPRPTQSTRWRQRIMHKFSYMPERINETGCTGCGRCSRACPVNMNILEHLTSIANHD